VLVDGRVVAADDVQAAIVHDYRQISFFFKERKKKVFLTLSFICQMSTTLSKRGSDSG